MINQEQYTRNSIVKTAVYGIDEALKKAPLYIEHADADTFSGQPVRSVWREMKIEADETGNPIRIITYWEAQQFTPTGLISWTFTKSMDVETNSKDMWDFIQMFCTRDGIKPTMQQFILNGHVRCIEGHNYEPLFNADGSVNTTADTLSAPTNSYQTHNADGTAIV